MVERALIVLGLGYGDEGKGITTDYLCSKFDQSLVIRFNGGQQAGHCVVLPNGKSHVFSNLGSGSFREVPTFWSNFCTFSPEHFVAEVDMVGINTNFYIDWECPVTTHYDILFNQTFELTLGDKKYGSCGLGFGATVHREKEGISLVFRDLMEDNLRDKIDFIRKHYRIRVNTETAYNFDLFEHDDEDLYFFQAVESIRELVSKKNIVPVTERDFFANNMSRWKTLIFEGAQGILLDQNFGEAPYVTKSNTTSRNAIEILNRNNLIIPTEIFYVSRAYQTRHGAGPFRDVHEEFELINNETETNILNPFQGEFRTNFLDINQLKYALKCDDKFSKTCIKNFVMTCLDQIPSENILCYINDSLITVNYNDIHLHLEEKFQTVYYSFGRDCNSFSKKISK